MEKTVISFSGRAHNGKTMLSEYLVNKYGFERLSVAGALKRICMNLLGFASIEAMNKEKATPKEYILKDVDIKFLSDESGVPYEFIKTELSKINNTLTSVRHALQYIGTDIFRKYDDDWHVKQLAKEIEESENDKLVIDDVRFLNEFGIMKNLDATLIFIVRPTIENVSHHKSDEELNWKMFDNVIINNTTENKAIEQLEDILQGKGNKIFDDTLKYYIELNVSDKYVMTDDNYHIKLIKDHICMDKFDITDNALIIEDLKKHLRYG